jgi:pimeloyl-ACP methyl ester carboxylesterase
MRNPKFIAVDGVRTRYFEAGSGDPLVLIHGGQFGSYYNAYHWSLNFDDLARSFRVYAFDKLGMGFTDNPASDDDYTMAAVIRHAYGLIEALGLSRVTLMGHSRGALPAARIALDHSEAISRLVILDSTTLAPESPAVAGDFYRKLEDGAPEVPDREFVSREPIANSHRRDHITDDFIEAMLEIARLPKTTQCRARFRALEPFFLQDLKRIKTETLDRIAAGELRAPTLLCWGWNDPSAPFQLGLDLFGRIAAGLDRVQLHLFNQAGHYIFREHARELNAVVARFAAAA